MSLLKKVFGWLFLFLGASCLVNGFLNAPYSEGFEATGFIAGGLIFASVFFYFGMKWVRKEVVV